MKIWIATLIATASLSAAVEDKIALFSPQAVAAANKELAAIKAKTGKEIVIMAVPDLGGKSITLYARDKAIERKLNGMIIVISKKPNMVEVLPGNKTSLVFTIRHRLDMVKMFRQSLRAKPDQTLGAVVSQLSDIFLKADKALIHEDQHDLAPAPAPAPAAAPMGSPWLRRLVFGIAFIVAAGIGIIVYRRKTLRTT